MLLVTYLDLALGAVNTALLSLSPFLYAAIKPHSCSIFYSYSTIVSHIYPPTCARHPLLLYLQPVHLHSRYR